MYEKLQGKIIANIEIKKGQLKTDHFSTNLKPM